MRLRGHGRRCHRGSGVFKLQTSNLYGIGTHNGSGAAALKFELRHGRTRTQNRVMTNSPGVQVGRVQTTGTTTTCSSTTRDVSTSHIVLVPGYTRVPGTNLSQCLAKFKTNSEIQVDLSRDRVRGLANEAVSTQPPTASAARRVTRTVTPDKRQARSPRKS